MNPNPYYGYQPSNNNYSQNITHVAPWPPLLPGHHIHPPLMPGQHQFHPSPLHTNNSPAHLPLPAIRSSLSLFPSHINGALPGLARNNNLDAMHYRPDDNNNNVNNPMGAEQSRKEPRSASESDLSKSSLTPTRKKLLERANKLKKFPIEVDPDLAEEAHLIKHQKATENAQRELMASQNIEQNINLEPVPRPRQVDTATITQIAELTRADLGAIAERIGMVTNNFIAAIRESEWHVEQCAQELDHTRRALEEERRARREECDALRNQLLLAQREIERLHRISKSAEENNNAGLRSSAISIHSNSSNASSLNNSSQIQPPTREKKAQEIPECQVCNDELCEIAFVPCGHFCVCQECSQRVDKCIICRSDITSKIKLFIT